MRQAKKQRIKEINKRHRDSLTPEQKRERRKRNVANAKPETKAKRKQYQYDYMRKRRPEFVERNRILANKRKEMLIDMFGRACADCGGTYPSAVFHFHHVQPKTNEVSNMLAGSLGPLMAEVAKCVMLCANCHIIRHSRETVSAMRDNTDEEEGRLEE